jgi:2,3-bisphosphoglycerate-independent phosphoglycerate mutase
MFSEVDPFLKLIYVVLDGLGDRPIERLGGRTPLEAAYTPNLDFLAERGKTGLMHTVEKGVAPESDVGVISILGYDPFKYHVRRGPIEAFGSGLHVKDGDLALRCNFATIDSNWRIIDRRAGRSLTTEEATQLAKAINDDVTLESYPADFEFKNTIGHRGVLVIRSTEVPLTGDITNTDPAYERVKGLGVAKVGAENVVLKCEPLNDSDGAEISADLVNEFVVTSHRVLEEHEVNRKRIASGKLNANILLMRDAGDRLPRFFDIGEKYGVRFSCLADMPVEWGIARLVGMHLVNLPSPSKDLEADYELRMKKMLEILPYYDCFYITIKAADEPGHDGNCDLKTRLIEGIDEYFFGRFLPEINLDETIICVTADHATPCELRTHSDDPVPLLISGGRVEEDAVKGFSEKECRKGSLDVIERGTKLMPILMKLLKDWR